MTGIGQRQRPIEQDPMSKSALTALASSLSAAVLREQASIRGRKSMQHDLSGRIAQLLYMFEVDRDKITLGLC